jgi:hypothetical protein
MNAEDLDTLSYIPALRSRQAELRGYRELRAEIKDAVIPIISIGKLGRTSESADVAAKVSECIDRPFFADLNTFAEQQCSDWQALASSDGNFQTWREYVATMENAVPIALIRDGAPERAFIRQVLAIEANHNVVAIRSRRPAAEFPLLQTAISAVEDVNNLLVILDLGYIRASIDAKEVEASRIINGLRNVDASVRIAVISSSFPRSISAFGEEAGQLEILERDLHARLGGSDVSIYGDHAAIYPEPFEASAARWVPRIDYATGEAWIFRRHRADDGGFPRCARELIAIPDWDVEFSQQNWGAASIRQQSTAEEPLPGFGSPSAWISVRVNMHIERQASVGGSSADDFEDVLG